ncbi:MAG: fibronectin type III domain-containing protein, partial [Rhodoluna sp.]
MSRVGLMLALVLMFSGLQVLDVASSSTPASAAAAGVNCASNMTAQNNLTATPSHGAVFYIDSGATPKVDASYVGYTIATTGADATLWVSLGDFIGGKVDLANPSDAYQQIKVTSSASATAFYLLKATGSTTSAQSHVVRVWDRRPDLANATQLLACDFAFSKVKETISANANKIGRVQATNNTAPKLGSLVTITVDTNGNDKTQTGTLGAGTAPDYSAFWASPAAYSSWPTQALRLESTSIVITCQSGSLTLTNRLFIADGASGSTLNNCIKSGQGSPWVGTYNFRVIGPGPSATTPSPIANISSGTQYKHSSPATNNTTINLSGVSAASSMAVTLTATKDSTDTSTGKVKIDYTAKVTNSSTEQLQVDEIVDKHDALGAGYGYIAGSTSKRQMNGATVVTASTSGPEPSVLAADAALLPPPEHFVGPFTGITSTSTQELKYSFYLPCDGVAHVATIYAYVGSVPITASATTASTITATANATTCATSVIQGTVAVDPTALTTPASSVAATTATLNGIVNSSGNTSTSYRFIYATDPNLAYATATNPGWTSIAGSPSTNTSYTSALTGLTPLTTYYFKIQVKNSSGTIFSGTTLSFTTLAQAGPVSVTTSA